MYSYSEIEKLNEKLASMYAPLIKNMKTYSGISTISASVSSLSDAFSSYANNAPIKNDFVKYISNISNKYT